jgi:hypothetical protein
LLLTPSALLVWFWVIMIVSMRRRLLDVFITLGILLIRFNRWFILSTQIEWNIFICLALIEISFCH